MTGTWPDSDDERIERALRTEGGHLSIGRSGFTLYYDHSWLNGYDCEEIKALCIARGVPVIDSRGVPFDDVYRLAVCGPMIAVGRPADEPPWRALSNAPLQVVADAYRAAGAEIVNLPESTPQAERA